MLRTRKSPEQAAEILDDQRTIWYTSYSYFNGIEQDEVVQELTQSVEFWERYADKALGIIGLLLLAL